VSIASLWEVVLEHQAGKLQKMVPISDFVANLIAAGTWRVLAINEDHLFTVCGLPMHHKDPFDRMLVAQAKVENMTLVTRDAALRAYGVSTIW
jgi:PIN domain nuclease of toxin-antitoxin system